VYNPTISGNSHLLAQPVIHATSSSIAELVSCAILTPAEVIKQNAQMVDGSSKSNATMETLRRFRSNPLALWRGYTALAGRNLPFTALQFPMFERLKEAIKEYRDRQGTRTNTVLESGIITAASAGSAGSVAAVITTPVDVVKTRIMLAAADTAAKEAQQETTQSQPQGTKNPGSGAVKNKNSNGFVDAIGQNAVKNEKPPARRSSMQIAREIVADHGVRGLWRGGALRAVWTMVGSGLYLGVYESGRIYLANRRGEKLKEEELL
jgi:solute carrier family 25 S-adenosylmethionine transporter 26